MARDDEFRQYLLVADSLLEQASHDQLAEALKILALNHGYLVQRHGEVPQDVLLRMTTADTLSAETRDLVMTGLGHLIGLLGHVMKIGEENETRH
jgi:hypothetical protein